jgi:hypothetical protein
VCLRRAALVGNTIRHRPSLIPAMADITSDETLMKIECLSQKRKAWSFWSSGSVGCFVLVG